MAGRSRRPLTLQAALGGEYSELCQTGAGGLSRQFVRPKGFVNLAWRPNPNLDVSARIERVVGQLNFFDFVASSNVSAGTSNSGNANLVPPQRWNGQVQAAAQPRPLGHRHRPRLWQPDHRHRRHHPDRRDRPVARQSRRHRDALRPAADQHDQLRSDRLARRQARRQSPVPAHLARRSADRPQAAVQRDDDARAQRHLAPRHSQHPMGMGRHRLSISPVGGLPARSALPLPRHAGQPRRLRRAQERVRADGARHASTICSTPTRASAAPSTTAGGSLDDSNRAFTEDRDRFYGPVFTLSISGTI